MEPGRITRACVVIAAALCAHPAWGQADDGELTTFTPTAAQLAIAARVDQVREQHSRSSDLRLRILFSMNGEIEEERRPDNGLYAKERISAADLYAQARGSTDPLVLDLLLVRCGFATKTRAACDREDLARRWTVADTQNQLAWLTLAAVLKEKGDLDGARGAFLRAAEASRWHEHIVETRRLVASAAPHDETVAMANAFRADAVNVSGLATPYSALSLLGAFCKEADPMRAACARILAVLVRDTDAMIALTLAVPYAMRANVAAPVVATYREEADAMHWALLESVPKGDVLEPTDEATARRDALSWQQLIDAGERRRAERFLLENHVTRQEAAARFVAGLSPEQKKQRAEMSMR